MNAEPAPRRQVSHHLFGNRYRLEIAAAVAAAADGIVYARELGRLLQGPQDNQITAVLASFVAAGILVRVDAPEGSRRVYYQRLDSPFWRLCNELNTTLRDPAAPPRGRDA